MREIVLVAVVALGCGGKSSSDTCEDADGDGVTDCDGDCDDADPLAVPGGNEICGDGADNNCDGAADDGCPGGIGTFVSSAIGDDSNPGTKASPKKTIAAGIANAAAIGGTQTVIVGEGTYAEKVSIAQGIGLQGGYQCDATTCDWLRDPVAHASVIVDQDFVGVVAGPGVTSATLFEGFRVIAKDGASPLIAAMTLDGGSPTISRNRFFGGAASGGTQDLSIALHIKATTDAAGALVEANEIVGGRASGLAAGLVMDSPGVAANKALATIRANMIRGGEGTRAIGLVAFNTRPGTIVTNNDIYAGTSNMGASHGIEVASTLTIDRNRINVDPALTGTCNNSRNWCAGIASSSSTSTITNNVVFGAKAARATAVRLGEFEVAAGTVILNGNVLGGGGNGTGNGSGTPTESAAVVLTIGTCTQCGLAGVVGRIRNNILDGGINQTRFGLREDPAQGRTIHAQELENNLFWFPPVPGPIARQDVFVLMQTGNGPKPLVTIDMVNAMTTPMAKLNITGNPMLNPTYHLMPGSPCQDKGTLVEAAPTDFDGDPRPHGQGVDIGADEM